MPKRDHIIKQTSRLGLTTKQLTTQELIELFYDIYNPAPTGTQRVLLDTAAYTAPLVQPAVEVPTPAPQPAQPASPAGGEPNDPMTQLPQTPPVSGLDLRPVTPPLVKPEASQPMNENFQPPVASANPTTQQPNNPITELRPVAPNPAPTAPTSSNFTPHQARLPATAAAGSVGQAEALSNLQAATAQAAQITNRPISAASNDQINTNE